jgi:4-amino-4-deoxy-L-arabinose transferase-like glycosyltransferase
MATDVMQVMDAEKPIDDASYWRWLLICAAVGLIPRLVLWTVSWSHPERAFFPDTNCYLRPALQLLQEGSYPSSGALRTPVYPFFIALVFAAFGRSSSRLILAQAVTSTLSVASTLALGRRLVPGRAAIAGSLLMALNLESITASFALLSETLFTFLFLQSVLAWVRFINSERRSSLVASAGWMGLSILCRPIALYFPALLLGAWLVRKRQALRAGLRQSAIYALVLAAMIAPWIWRNARAAGIATVSTISNRNLLYYEAAALDAYEGHVTADEVRSRYDVQVQKELDRLGLENTEANRARIWGQMAGSILATHPFRYAWIHLKADRGSLLPDVTTLTEMLGLTTGGRGTLSVLQRDGLTAAMRHYFGGQLWLAWLLGPFSLLLLINYLSAVWGAWMLVRWRNWSTLVVLLAPLAYYLVLPGPASVPRFRVPVVPYLMLLSGLGLHMALRPRAPVPTSFAPRS